MQKQAAQNCWQVFGCKNAKCPAYKKNNNPTKCWRLASKYTEDIPSGVRITGGIKRCWECSYFKQVNPEFFSA